MLRSSMFRIFLIVVSLVFLAMDTPVFSGSPTPESEESFETPMPITPFPEQVPALKLQAVDGSPRAAFLLALYFYGDPKEEIYWMMIAAENGGPDMQSLLAGKLHQQHDELNTRRARYWYNRIIKTGTAEEAQKAKEELAAWEREQKFRSH